MRYFVVNFHEGENGGHVKIVEKLSLTEKEESGFVMPRIRRKNDFWIAAKFLTPRALNMDAVGRTFK